MYVREKQFVLVLKTCLLKFFQEFQWKPMTGNKYFMRTRKREKHKNKKGGGSNYSTFMFTCGLYYFSTVPK